MHSSRWWILGVALAAGIAATPVTLPGQFPTDLQVGTRIRVWLPEPHPQMEGARRQQLLRGTVDAVEADTLRVSIPGAFGSVAVPRASIHRLEVSRGQPDRLSSAADRVVGTALAGAALFVLMNRPPGARESSYRTNWRAAGAGAATGAGFGVFLGLVLPHERWRRVRLAP